MRNTFLFDLDGTLLPMNQDEFVELYFNGIETHFAGRYDTQQLKKTVWAGTMEMVKNQGHKTNEEVFWDTAEALIDIDRESVREEFEEFYSTTFEVARQAASARDDVVKFVRALRNKGYKIVAATNPLFPVVATRNRINWAGFTWDDFDLVTTYDMMHYSKPNVDFYNEILQLIGKKPEECVMVGNDNQEDMCAETLGIEGYLITDHMINRDDAPITCKWHGTYDEFIKLQF